MSITNNLGIMQGRLIPDENGTIQSFPIKGWKDEFPIMQSLNLKYQEWTIDLNGFKENPICTDQGVKKILTLQNRFNVSVRSVTCDFVMHVLPFEDIERKTRILKNMISQLCKYLEVTDVKYLVLPFVDKSSPTSLIKLVELCTKLNEQMRKGKYKQRILLELDLEPKEVLSLYSDLPKQIGINYDTGNSAGLGYDSELELSTFGHLIENIHIKDKVLNGITCELGDGDYNFSNLAEWYKEQVNDSKLILQAARPANKTDDKQVAQYIRFVKNLFM